MVFPENLSTNNELERTRGKRAFPSSEFTLWSLGPDRAFPSDFLGFSETFHRLTSKRPQDGMLETSTVHSPEKWPALRS